MRGRLARRGSVTALGMYGATVLGFLATVVAARVLGPYDFGLFALVVATTGFLQLLLDSTVEEALVKYGFRYAEREDWGRLRRLFRLGLVVKSGGSVVAALALLAVAPAARAIFDADGLLVPLLVAAALPLVQAPESVAGAALIVRGRYDVRALVMSLAMGLRLVGVAVGARYGVAEALAGMVLAQVLATGAIGVLGVRAFRGFPAAEAGRMADDRGPVARFVGWSALGSGLSSARTTLPAVLVGVVATPVQVAYFRAAQASQTGFASLSAPARLVLLAEQTSDVEAGRVERVYRLLRRYVTGTAILTVVVVPPLLLLMPDVLRLVYGAEYLPATDAARLIVLAAAVQLVWGWTKSFPISIGRPQLRIVAHGVELVVLVPLLLVLGSRWGAAGAAAAVAASTGAFALLWTWLLLRVRREALAPQDELTPLPTEVVAP